MSKSNLKPEDIFFGIQKTYERKPKEKSEPIATPVPAKEKEPTATAPIETPNKQKEQKAAKATAPEKKKRGPAPNPENSNRVSINVQMQPEVKYTMVAVINEMKLQGIKDRYNITDFVTEAIEEKIKRSKKQLGME